MTCEGSLFIFEGGYEDRQIPKSAGFVWNSIVSKKWATRDTDNAVKLIEYAGEECKAELQRILAGRKENVEKSRETSAELEIPAPKGLEYMPFQKAGVEYAMERVNTLIADEMGLGKTIEAIGVINIDKGIKKVLVVCPASLRLNWKQEIEKWLTRILSVGIAESKTGFPGTDVVIINYDILKKFHDNLRGIEWDILIVDECQYLKNPKAIRTKELLGGKSIKAIPSRKKLFLTGTPILNRPIELWTLTHALGLFSSWYQYITRYCNGFRTGFGWDVSGASNLEELQEKLRSTIMVRRLKSEVLTELPAKRRQIIEIPANGIEAIVEKENKAWNSRKKEIRELQVQVELAKAGSEKVYEEAVNKLRDAMNVAFSEMAELRHRTALAKVPFVVQFLKDIIEDGHKVVCFTHHRDVASAIEVVFMNICVKITGETSMQERQEAVKRFQEDKKCLLFIGTIKVAGLGITLTSSSHVVFAELDWTPANITQAEDRTHRIGQREAVLVQHVVLENSLDAKMVKRLLEKQKVIDKALDDEGEKDISVKIVDVGNELPTRNVGRKAIQKEAEKITEEEIKEIHQALKFLSARCDGARAIDGQGFNKIDSGIGKSLADWGKLTPAQACLGKRIIGKYGKQLEER